MKRLYVGFLIYVGILLGWQLSLPKNEAINNSDKIENIRIASNLQIIKIEQEKN